MQTNEDSERSLFIEAEKRRKISNIKKWIRDGARWGRSGAYQQVLNLPGGHSIVTSFAVSPDDQSAIYVVYVRTDHPDQQTWLANYDNWEKHMEPTYIQ